MQEKLSGFFFSEMFAVQRSKKCLSNRFGNDCLEKEIDIIKTNFYGFDQVKQNIDNNIKKNNLKSCFIVISNH